MNRFGQVLPLAIALLAVPGGAQASEEMLDRVEGYTEVEAGLPAPEPGMEQVNSVFQLSDVSPGDWAFEALRNLVESYGCIAGYPDGTYRGTQALSRYEFAAGLNACLESLEFGGLTAEELDTLRALVAEFQTELATLGARVDNLEGRVTFLEENQFSVTTKLNGEVIFDLAATFGDEQAVSAQGLDPEDEGEDVSDAVLLTTRVRLHFDTSFSGEDRLRTRLEAANNGFLSESTGTLTSLRNLSPPVSSDSIRLDQLLYSFPVGDRVTAHVGATGVLVDDIFDAAPTAGPAYDSTSLFAAYNNLVYDISSSDGAAVGANIEVTDTIQVDIGYFAPEGSSPTDGIGNGDFATGAQIGFDFGDFDASVVYLRSYQSGGDLSGFVGSPAAADPFLGRANSANHYGLQVNYLFGDRFNIGGYAGLVDAKTQGSLDGDALILNWAANVAVLDLLKEGSTLLLVGGQAPKLIDSSGFAVEEDPDSTYVIDLEYAYPITDNIDIRPAAYVIINPDGNDENDTIVVGRIRSRFTF